MTIKHQTIFSDEKYQIRTLAAPDALKLHAAVRASVAELSTWMPWCTESYGLSDSEQYLSRCTSNLRDNVTYDFGVFDATTEGMLGAVAITGIRRGENCANIGYWTRSDATGRGIATQAVRAAAVFGFQKLGLTRLEILAHPGNLSSRRVAEKLGGWFEGYARNRIVFRGEPRAAVVYSLIPEDIRG